MRETQPSEMDVFLHLYKKFRIINTFVILQPVREQVRREEFGTKHRKEEQSGAVQLSPRKADLCSSVRQEAMQPDQRAAPTTYSFHLEQPAAGQPFPGSDRYLARATTVRFQLESFRKTKVFQVIRTIPPRRERKKHECLPS